MKMLSVRLCNTQRLSVNLLATSRKKYWWDLYETFTRDVSVDDEDIVKFWN